MDFTAPTLGGAVKAVLLPHLQSFPRNFPAFFIFFNLIIFFKTISSSRNRFYATHSDSVNFNIRRKLSLKLQQGREPN